MNANNKVSGNGILTNPGEVGAGQIQKESLPKEFLPPVPGSEQLGGLKSSKNISRGDNAEVVTGTSNASGARANAIDELRLAMQQEKTLQDEKKAETAQKIKSAKSQLHRNAIETAIEAIIATANKAFDALLRSVRG